MSATDAAAATPAITVAHDNSEPSTPLDNVMTASQPSLPSTDASASPIDGQSFKNELSDQRAASASVIPSSMTPPSSSQVAPHHPSVGGSTSARPRQMLSPPVTAPLTTARVETMPVGLYTALRPDTVVAASPDELRSMLQDCIAEHTRLKTEAAHHKLQYQLLSVRADEDAHRAAVEQEMTVRQLQALQRPKLESSRPATRAATSSPDITQAMYDQLRTLSDRALKDKEKMHKDYEEAGKRLKGAKKLIIRQEEDIDSLREENEMLRNRLQDKRELWNHLASPGGMFHTPKTAQPSPSQYRTTPRNTPKHHREMRGARQEPFAVLLQAATQENSSAPSTPITPKRSAGRQPLKHSRGLQSLSCLPLTPNAARPRGADLLPAADLVPQTEPPRRLSHRPFLPATPERGLGGCGRTKPHERAGRRHSRESTISAGDNEELARAALQSVARQATSFASRGSPAQRKPLPSQPSQLGEGESQVVESQASQEASAMLRRDTRGRLEAAKCHKSRDVTPTPMSTDNKPAKLQSTLRGPIVKPGLPHLAKRKSDDEEARRPEPTSPTKRLRMAGGLREGASLIGLGIRE